MAAPSAFQARPVGVLACLGLVAIALLPWQLARRSRVPVRDDLFVRPEQLDFGSIVATNDLVWELQLENTTDAVIEIDSFALSCHCTKVEPSQLSIPPRESRLIRLHLDLLPQSTAELSSQERPFAVNVKPKFRSGGPQHDGWQVTGSVESPFELVPGFVNFGETLVEGQPYPRQRVEVRSRRPIDELDAASDHEAVEVSVTPDPKVADHFTLEIQPLPSLGAGPHDFDVQLTGRSGGSCLDPYPLKIRATVLPNVRSTPRSLSLGMAEAGSALEGDVVLSSRDDRPCEVLAAELPTGFEVVGGLPKAPARSHALRVRVASCKLGPQTHLLSFAVRTTGETARTLKIRASYLGRDAVLKAADAVKPPALPRLAVVTAPPE